MPKITPRGTDNTITVKTKTKTDNRGPADWWNAGSKREMSEKLLGTASYLKEQNQYRYRQNGLYARLYGNMPLYGWVGSNLTKMTAANQLPVDRPTMSVITSCVDTLVSRITQARPRPTFLTDNGDSKERKLAKQMNTFINGELYQTKAYAMGELILRDACVLGTGVTKVLETTDKRVGLERKLNTEILVDPNDSLYGSPRQLYEVALVDRQVLAESFPEYRSTIEKAETAYPDNSGESGKTVSDLVLVVEGWHLASGPDAKDGVHTIACSEGVLRIDDTWKKKTFPFAFLHFSPRMLGFFGQGLAEQLMGTQSEINKLLMTISASINLVGVPRVFVEEGSKVVKAHLNNNIGSIVTYRGTKPQYEIAPCVPQEIYGQLQRLVDFAYQQSGISSLSAASQKPAGLNSGAALREYDDLQTDRFAALAKRYENYVLDLTYLIIDQACDIVKRDGKYETIYPNKNGTKSVELKDVSKLEDPFVIQCYDVSSLPRDPSGRLQKVTEMMQAGLISPQEGRRLLDYPDVEQVDKLATAAEERILQVMDEIVEEGKYTPPDPFMDLAMAEQICVQYYNLYVAAKLDEKRAQLLRDFFDRVQVLKQAAMPPQPMGGPGGPQAAPMPTPQSELIPNVAGA